jgi:hypothetical protein
MSSQTSTWKLVSICVLSGLVLGYNSGIIAPVNVSADITILNINISAEKETFYHMYP